MPGGTELKTGGGAVEPTLANDPLVDAVVAYRRNDRELADTLDLSAFQAFLQPVRRRPSSPRRPGPQRCIAAWATSMYMHVATEGDGAAETVGACCYGMGKLIAPEPCSYGQPKRQ